MKVVPVEAPRPRNPQEPLREPTRPPGNRSREAHGLVAMAAAGRFALQVCDTCGRTHYPPQQFCGNCLGAGLTWRDVSNAGTLLARTILHHANELYFKARLPWRIGLVQLDAGPRVVVHLSEDCARGQRLRVSLTLDRAGNAAMSAQPEHSDEARANDAQTHEMAVEPRNRRVLIVDGKTPLGAALAERFLRAGARAVYVGYARGWRNTPSLEQLRHNRDIALHRLDVTDTDSVSELAALLGGKVEILVNNSYHLRPGGASGRMDLNATRDEMEVHYHGLLRLAGAFGPAMRARGADGPYGALAWLNVFSIYALVNRPEFGTYCASQAAAQSVSQCLRAELAHGGVRVLNAYLGPLDDEWHQQVPAPKLDARVAARRIVEGLAKGREELAVGPIAEEILARLRENPKEVERALAR